MKKFVLVLSLIAILIPMYPVEAKLKYKDVEFMVCEYGNGTFRVTARVHLKGTPGVKRWAISRVGGGKFESHGRVIDGWSITYTGLAEGTRVVFRLGPKFIKAYRIRLSAEGNYLPCTGKSSNGASPLFHMWLLTKADNSYCILISEALPAKESQAATCFPGKEWVTDNALCSGYVYDNGFWECDEFGYERLPLSDLCEIYQRHLAKVEELTQKP